MSNNRYKNAFNQIEVSDRAIDNLYDIATTKQRRTNNVAKKIIATVTAFILVIGGGFLYMDPDHIPLFSPDSSPSAFS